ncbi:MAG TPA: 50S ribosomal protein L23 [Firmicutes bacterium]|jgi:large subunit ribosomal protein L23|nr:50S ribosomal protein L23 [Bacillota bacterium]
MSTSPRDVILKPIISEKSMAEMAEGKYTFAVMITASKNEIRDAVEKIFNVKVESVKTMRVHGKPRRQGVFRGHKPDWKKAIVALQEGDRIKFFEGMV